jgi:hypothetical protein
MVGGVPRREFQTSREGMIPRPKAIAQRKISKIDQRKNRPSR